MHSAKASGQGRQVLLAGSLLAFVFGSVHAFSVFTEPLEARFGASRAAVSLTYSLALVSITAAVSLGGMVYHRAPAWLIVCGLTALGILGGVLAAISPGLPGVWLGYGLLLGLANGTAYGYMLQLSAQANPGREGAAMGVITALYAVGAMVFPLVFEWALSVGGFSVAMFALVGSIACAGALAALVLAKARARFARTEETSRAELPLRGLARLWLAYGAAVAAGLMAMGHAVGIAREAGVAPALVVAAPIIVSVCNMAGSLGGGLLADRIPTRPMLVALPLVSALVLGAMGAGMPLGALTGLGLVGLVYGAVITLYPAAIARQYGVAPGVRIYGRVFTAWAVAGLGGPLLAGWVYDRSADYSAALMIAAALGVASAAIAALPTKKGG